MEAYQYPAEANLDEAEDMLRNDVESIINNILDDNETDGEDDTNESLNKDN